MAKNKEVKGFNPEEMLKIILGQVAAGKSQGSRNSAGGSAPLPLPENQGSW